MALKSLTLSIACRRTPRAVRRLVLDEGGAAYTLSYVMVFPILMLLVALSVESALMLMAKLGTVHAAYVAARVAAVQGSARDWPNARQRIEQATRQAMVPFANGANRSSGTADDLQQSYRRAYRQWADDAVADGYIQSKQRDVGVAVQVEVGGPPTSWQSEITAEVTYRYPFRVPGLGRLLGERSDSGFTFPLTSRVTLPNDGPQNQWQDMGIGYGRE